MSKARDLGDSASVINILDGSAAGTIVNSKAVAYGASGEVNATTLQLSGSAISSTAAELNVLDGIPGTLTSTELGYVDGVTSNIQTQLNNISVTNGTLTKTFAAGEAATVTLTGNVLVPSVTVTKEVSQTGSTNNDWNVNSSSENYTRYNSAAATTLSFDTYAIGSATPTSAFSVSGQDGEPKGLTFNTDGTKMFVVGAQGDDVNEFALTTGFNVTTASMTRNLSIGQGARDVKFNNDGTKMFVACTTSNSVREYALTTGFDLSSASYTRQKTVNSQTTNPVGVAFNSDGTKMFVIGGSGGSGDRYIFEYSVSTGFDLSSVSYANQYEMGTNNTNPGGLAFDSTGKKILLY